MKANKKLFAKAMGVFLSMVVVFTYYGQTVLAAENDNRPGSLNGGMALLLEPQYLDTEEMISEVAQTLNLDLEDLKEEKDSTLVMANVKEELKIRNAASEDAKVVGYLYKDCGGEILERKDGWTKLRSGNVVGWASDEFLFFGEEAENLAYDAGKKIATVDAVILRVRKEAADNAEVLGLLPEGERMDVLDKETEEDWICIDYNGEDGFVAAEYVTVTFQIDAGETLDEKQARLKAERDATRHVNYGEFTVDADTTLLLAALIHCEAGGEPYEGQVAVGAVVMNRVRSPAYPNTIHGVIYASGQFTPAMSGKVNRVLESGKIYESCIRAAQEALSGVSNVGDLTHSRRVNGREGLIIGNHVFY